MPKPLGIFRTYKEEILEHAKKNMPYSHIADVLIAKYKLTTSREILRQEISRGLRRSGNSITKPENVEQGREMPTTNSSTFHALKTELGLHENTFGLPEPWDDSVKHYKLPTGCNNILFIGDLQIPFHDIPAITCALKYGQEQGVNTIYLNGDICDHYSVSSYEKRKEFRNIVEEIRMTREFLGILRNVFPNATIIYKLGNHEIRWARYIRQNAK
jgi:hypothetical protein